MKLNFIDPLKTVFALLIKKPNGRVFNGDLKTLRWLVEKSLNKPGSSRYSLSLTNESINFQFDKESEIRGVLCQDKFIDNVTYRQGTKFKKILDDEHTK